MFSFDEIKNADIEIAEAMQDGNGQTAEPFGAYCI